MMQLSDYVVALHEARSFEQVTETALQCLSTLVPCDWPMVSALVSGPPNLRIATPRSPLRSTWQEFDERGMGLIHQDPTYTNRLRLTMDGAAQPADFLERNEFERTRFFNDVWRPMNIRQMLRFSNPGILGTGFVIARTSNRPFSADEIDMAEVIGRQMDAAIFKLMSRFNGKVPLDGVLIDMHTSSWLVCSAAGEILRSTPASREHYTACAGEFASLRRIPTGWHDVFVSRMRGGPPQPKEYRVAGRSIVVHVAPIAGCDDEFSVFFVEHAVEQDPLEKLVELGLTWREAEVLHWMIEGKTNPEIATIMGISTLTAKKHVENIRTKFQVPNRTAAVVYAMDKLR
jgi:DNA-binding CsgD family transcriptional regulator